MESSPVSEESPIISQEVGKTKPYEYSEEGFMGLREELEGNKKELQNQEYHLIKKIIENKIKYFQTEESKNKELEDENAEPEKESLRYSEDGLYYTSQVETIQLRVDHVDFTYTPPIPPLTLDSLTVSLGGKKHTVQGILYSEKSKKIYLDYLNKGYCKITDATQISNLEKQPPEFPFDTVKYKGEWHQVPRAHSCQASETNPRIDNNTYNILPGSFTGIAGHYQNMRYVVIHAMETRTEGYGFADLIDFTTKQIRGLPVPFFPLIWYKNSLVVIDAHNQCCGGESGPDTLHIYNLENFDEPSFDIDLEAEVVDFYQENNIIFLLIKKDGHFEMIKIDINTGIMGSGDLKLSPAAIAILQKMP